MAGFLCLFLAGARGEGNEAREREELKALRIRDPLTTAETLDHLHHWSPLAWATDSPTAGHIVAGQGWAPTGGFPAIAGAFWDTEDFGRQEKGDGVAAYVGSHPAVGHYFALWLNMQNPGTTKAGYRMVLTWREAGYEVALERWDDSTHHTLLGLKTGVLFEGYFGLTYFEGRVKGWTGDTGNTSFTLALNAPDRTYPSGFAGMEASGADIRLRNFSADRFHLNYPAEKSFCGNRASLTYYGGECWDQPRRPAAFFREAALICARAGGHLPEVMSYYAFTSDKIPPLAEGEWVDQVNPGGSNQYYGLALLPNNLLSIPGEVSRPYRCAYPVPGEE